MQEGKKENSYGHFEKREQRRYPFYLIPYRGRSRMFSRTCKVRSATFSVECEGGKGEEEQEIRAVT